MCVSLSMFAFSTRIEMHGWREETRINLLARACWFTKPNQTHGECLIFIKSNTCFALCCPKLWWNGQTWTFLCHIHPLSGCIINPGWRYNVFCTINSTSLWICLSRQVFLDQVLRDTRTKQQLTHVPKHTQSIGLFSS